MNSLKEVLLHRGYLQWSAAVQLLRLPHRKAEGFSIVGAMHALGFAMGGLFLAVLSLRGMLLAAAVTGMITLV